MSTGLEAAASAALRQAPVQAGSGGSQDERAPVINLHALTVLPSMEDLVDKGKAEPTGVPPVSRARSEHWPMLAGAFLSLPRNHGGPWHSMDAYIDAHFRLLREDYVDPLREVLQQYLRNDTRERQRFVVYGLKVHGPSSHPLTFNASFTVLNRRDMSRVFAHDSRLKYGSLVALLLFTEAENGSRSLAEMLFATVASYRRDDAMAGKTTLTFLPKEAQRLRSEAKYIAIERWVLHLWRATCCVQTRLAVLAASVAAADIHLAGGWCC